MFSSLISVDEGCPGRWKRGDTDCRQIAQTHTNSSNRVKRENVWRREIWSLASGTKKARVQFQPTTASVMKTSPESSQCDHTGRLQERGVIDGPEGVSVHDSVDN